MSEDKQLPPPDDAAELLQEESLELETEALLQEESFDLEILELESTYNDEEITAIPHSCGPLELTAVDPCQTQSLELEELPELPSSDNDNATASIPPSFGPLELTAVDPCQSQSLELDGLSQGESSNKRVREPIIDLAYADGQCGIFGRQTSGFHTTFQAECAIWPDTIVLPQVLPVLAPAGEGGIDENIYLSTNGHVLMTDSNANNSYLCVSGTSQIRYDISIRGNPIRQTSDALTMVPSGQPYMASGASQIRYDISIRGYPIQQTSDALTMAPSCQPY